MNCLVVSPLERASETMNPPYERSFGVGGAGAVVLAVAMGALTALPGCRDATTRPIRLAYQNRVGSAACIVAVENGLFAEEGLLMQPSRFNSGPACVSKDHVAKRTS